MTTTTYIDYAELAARLQASPLYKRLGCRHAVAKMLMTKVHVHYMTREEETPRCRGCDYPNGKQGGELCDGCLDSELTVLEKKAEDDGYDAAHYGEKLNDCPNYDDERYSTGVSEIRTIAWKRGWNKAVSLGYHPEYPAD